MMYLSWVSKRNVLGFVLAMLAMQLLLTHSVLSLNQTDEYLHHICLKGDGIFKSNNYDKRVTSLLDSMSEFYLKYGFSYAVGGDGDYGPDKIYAKIQCRGDGSKSMCQSCMSSTALTQIRKKCPNNKGRIIWYDYCVLILSSISTAQQIDYRDIFYLNNVKDVSTDKNSFNKNTKAFLYKLKEKAISKDKMKSGKDFMYAAGEENIQAAKLYGMVQCAQDLTTKNCSICFDGIMKEFPKCCNGKQGGRVLSPSCNFRYEFYPFVKL